MVAVEGDDSEVANIVFDEYAMRAPLNYGASVPEGRACDTLV